MYSKIGEGNLSECILNYLNNTNLIFHILLESGGVKPPFSLIINLNIIAINKNSNFFLKNYLPK